MEPGAQAVARDLARLASPERAMGAARFFQTGPGDYGEGDRFLGVTVPGVRAVCKNHQRLSLSGIDALLASEWHEHRLAALILLSHGYERGDEDGQAERYALYLARTDRVNNWDLVDTSADRIVGAHLDVVGTEILQALAESSSLWERRIAMVATYHRIKRGEAADALRIAELLLADRHPLIHKASGWMLREVGKRVDERELTGFLDVHAGVMPATMLSYAAEHLTPMQRAHYRLMRRAGAGR